MLCRLTMSALELRDCPLARALYLRRRQGFRTSPALPSSGSCCSVSDRPPPVGRRAFSLSSFLGRRAWSIRSLRYSASKRLRVCPVTLIFQLASTSALPSDMVASASPRFFFTYSGLIFPLCHPSSYIASGTNISLVKSFREVISVKRCGPPYCHGPRATVPPGFRLP